MSAAKTLIIQFEEWKHFKSRVTKTLKTKAPSITKKNVLVFASVTDYQKFMNEQKLAILAVIANKKPTSIYQLAQLVDRDFANVQRDCVALAAHGFIELKESGDAKKSKIPKLAFDYDRILVRMPSVSYSHDLLTAA